MNPASNRASDDGVLPACRQWLAPINTTVTLWAVAMIRHELEMADYYGAVRFLDGFLLSADAQHAKCSARTAVLMKHYRNTVRKTPVMKNNIKTELAKIGLDPETMPPTPALPTPLAPAPAP